MLLNSYALGPIIVANSEALLYSPQNELGEQLIWVLAKAELPFMPVEGEEMVATDWGNLTG